MLRNKIFSTSKDILNLIKYRSFVHLLINEAIIPYFYGVFLVPDKNNSCLGVFIKNSLIFFWLMRSLIGGSD